MEHKVATLAKDERLYLVTHDQLSLGCQTVQVAHAMANFALDHPRVAARWTALSNVIVVLTVENAMKLVELQQTAQTQELEVSSFREGDLCDELTALAFTPCKLARKLLTELPLFGSRVQAEQQALVERERKLFALSQSMVACFQTPQQNMLQHGSDVRDHYFQILDHLRGTKTLRNPLKWKIPTWVEENRKAILNALPSAYVMDRYLTLHDCGKTRVAQTDANQHVHFPDHALASEEVFRGLGECETAENTDIAYLIAHDMDLHTVNVKPFSEFFSSGFAMGQILAAWAELISNAPLFGGLESTSFKIKFKRVERRGKMFFDYLNSLEKQAALNKPNAC